MSYYTVFDEIEPTLSSCTTGTTTVIANTDVVLAHNTLSGRKYQMTLGSLQGVNAVTYFTTLAFYTQTTATSLGAYSTSASTAFVPNYGISCFRSTTGTSCIWVLQDPTVVGQTKTLMWDNTATTTGYFVQPVAATITSTASPTGVFVNFANGTISPQGGSITLVALSTARWMVQDHSTGVLFS